MLLRLSNPCVRLSCGLSGSQIRTKARGATRVLFGSPLLGRTYPEPIVDVANAARRARDRVWAVRKGDAFRSEARRVVDKHASRKDSAGHFVNDRAPKRRKARVTDDRQAGFDF